MAREPTEEGPGRPEFLLRAWSRRYLWVLGAVALLVVVDQAILQPRLAGLSLHAPRINVAGRQRMLSQRIAKETLALALVEPKGAGENRRAELARAIQQWTTAHRALVNAAQDSRPAREALRGVEPALEAIVRIAASFAGAEEAADRSRLAELLDEETRFLQGMERVVSVLEDEARRAVTWLRWSGLVLMVGILGLIGGVHAFVLRPATALIRDQIERLAASETEHRRLSARLAQARGELELRVAERTAELKAANAALAREIAERRASESRTRELSARLAHAGRVTALGQLATGLAHEINQPLATIVSCADTAELCLEREGAALGPAGEAIARVKQAALRAGAIVRRMRNFVRKKEPARIEVDLGDLIGEVRDLCQPRLEETGARLTLDISGTPRRVFVDPIEIQQVLVNLIQNALDAVAIEPRARRAVEVRAEVDWDQWRVAVSDTGPGFAANAIGEGFTPFTSSKEDGLGMGLAISRAIVERYRGRLWAENRPGGGARVVFTIPMIGAYESETGRAAHGICR